MRVARLRSMAGVSRFTVVAGVLGLAGIGLLIGCQVPVTPWPGSSAANSGAAVETHYSPTENLEHYDLALLKSAHRSIDLCGFSFTDEAVGDAIESAARRGVRVRVYLDRGQSDDELERAAKHDGEAKPVKRKRNVEFADGFFSEDEATPASTSEAVIAALAALINATGRPRSSGAKAGQPPKVPKQ